MSATFNKLMIVGTTTFALLILASGAAAAPSLGFPKGRPYYGSSNQGSGGRTFRSYAPAFSTEARQSYSYEPAEKVAPAQGGCHQHAVVVPATPQKDVAAVPRTTRRSFSYEPSIQPQPRVRSYRNAAPKKDVWLYPKGDARRYGR